MWELIGSVITGGATGLLGVGISAITEHFKQKQKNEHELALVNAERETLALEIEGRERVVTIQGETERDIADANAFAESLAADRATYSSGQSQWLVLVDVVRGLTRPVITAYLILLITILWFTTDDSVMQTKIISTVLYVTTAAVLWWFGSRTKKPQ